VPTAKPGLVQNDSVTVVLEFSRNAKPILDSLTRLHFLRRENGLLLGQNKKLTTERDGMTTGYIQSQRQVGALAGQVMDLSGQLGQYRQKYRRGQVEVWLWRLGAAYLVYKRICPSCRP